MALIALIGAVALLWLVFGGKVLRDQRNWPALGAMVIGVVFLAKGHPLAGIALAVAGAAWLRIPQWRSKKKAPAKPFIEDMALAEARDLLGLPMDADRDAIIAAHRRLIARNHPDSGGTEALAARLNAARDLLLKQNRL